MKTFPSGEQPKEPTVEYSEPLKHIKELQERINYLETRLTEIGKDLIYIQGVIRDSVEKYKAARLAGEHNKSARVAEAIREDGETEQDIIELLEFSQKEYRHILDLISKFEEADKKLDAEIGKLTGKEILQ